jgi:hypothetical protein
VAHTSSPAGRALWRLAAMAVLCSAPLAAHASFLSPEMEDKVADILTIVVLFVAPAIGIAVFWIVHVLPEKIAEKKQHPQKHAIHTLCLLSLVFGGLLWPVAWLWAYTRPIGYKLAYGTDKDNDYYEEHGAELLANDHTPVQELVQLRDELDHMASKGALPVKLQALRVSLGLRIAADAAVPTVG